MIHAIVYTVVQETTNLIHRHDPASNDDSTTLPNWEIFFSFVLNSTLSLLLVFRLNRAAERFWIARHYWGDIVAYSRSMVSGILTHGCNDPAAADALRYVAMWALASKDLLRKDKNHKSVSIRKITTTTTTTTTTVDGDTYAGFISEQQVQHLQGYSHPPMVLAGRLRLALKQCFACETDSTASAIRLDRLEDQLNRMIWAGGGLERIKNTPLPMVYVSHLRTFLLINLLLFPWVFGGIWRWSTIPIVAVSSYAWLGIEGAAAEVESPFSQHRVNALNMNAYVIHLIQTLQEQLQCHVDDMEEPEAAFVAP